MIKKDYKYYLSYIPDAMAYTDAPSNITSLIG